MRAGGSRAWRGGTVLLLLLGVDVRAGEFEGAVTLEVEYLGESFWSRQTFSAADLGLPTGSSLLVSDTTRFQDDSWLPGPRVDLRWRGGSPGSATIDLASRTEANAERVQEDVELRLVLGDLEASRWLVRALGGVREEERSLVGHGDWKAGLELTREQRLGPSLAGLLRASVEHSRTRGDTASYLYDYDLLRARAAVQGGGTWLHTWEAFAEAAAKETPFELPGAYRELRAGGAWLPDGGLRRLLDLELSWRDYDGDSVGRDEARAEASWRGRLMGGEDSGLDAELRGVWTNVVGSDEVYFDAAELEVEFPWTTGGGTWSATIGPAFEALWDLDAENRDYRQGSLRAGGSRRFGGSGFVEIDLEGGLRDYLAAEAEVVEVSSLSAALLRSDYWLLDLLVLAGVPLGPRTTLDVLGSFAWEFHEEDTERVHVGFLTVGVTRRF